MDNFKYINDTLGHDIGDELLKLTSIRLQSCLRRSDYIFRLGGDEFTIVLNDLTEDTDIAKVAKKILEEIDMLSKQENMTRSELIRKAFQTYVEVLTEKKRERKKRKGIERAVELQDEIRSSVGDLDLVTDLRNWRDKRK